MAKFYAVKVGLVPGVYETWAECKANVDGYSGAQYKSFSTKEEAEVYAGLKAEIKKEIALDEHSAIAYVDGSYNDKIDKASYGVVILTTNGTKKLAGLLHNHEGSKHVAGEVFAAKRAMDYCLNNELTCLDIYYDNAGIEAWATREYEATKSATKEYVAFYDKAISAGLKITFHKVKAHSHNQYNNLADELAKKVFKS